MTAVVFRIDYKHGAVTYRRGQYTQLPDAEARALADTKIVEIRPPHQPSETKGATA